MKHKVQIQQVFTAYRTIVVEIEAETAADAIEQFSSGMIDVPSMDDGGWLTTWHLDKEFYRTVHDVEDIES